MCCGLYLELRFLFITMTDEKQNAVQKKSDTGSQIIARVDELCKVGFTMPKDYNYVNAIKATMLALQDVKDRNQRPALEVCSPVSIQSAVFEMATKGLDVSKKQAYFIVKGGNLCLHESYFGKILQVKRIYPDFNPVPRVIYQGDTFDYRTDPQTGRKELVEHTQRIENIDNDFVGAYLYLPCPDGGKDLYIMTRKQIYAAWMKSPNKSLSTHKEFTDKMISKTIINSGCNIIINSTPELAQSADDEFIQSPEVSETPATADVDYEEVNIDETEYTEPEISPSEPETSEPQQPIDDNF
jgi:recombination protein RecT